MKNRFITLAITLAVLFVAYDHLSTVFLLAYVYLGFKIGRVFYTNCDCFMKGAFMGFIAILVGLFFPLAFWFTLIDSDNRESYADGLRFIVKNRFYYLRNPVVIRKSDDEDSNKEPRSATAKDYLRPRSRH